MPVAIYNRGQIIRQATQLGGNPGLATIATGQSSSLAQDFFDALLDHVFRGWDWSHLKKITTVTADATDFSKIPAAALPADYGRFGKMRAAGVKAAAWLKPMTNIEDLWLRRQIDSENNVSSVVTPIYYAIDEGSASAASRPDIYVYQKPTARLTYDFIYYRLPPRMTVGVGGDASFPELPDVMFLVQAMTAWVKDYTKDPQAALSDLKAAKAFAEFRANHEDKGRDGSMILPLDPNFFPDYSAD